MYKNRNKRFETLCFKKKDKHLYLVLSSFSNNLFLAKEEAKKEADDPWLETVNDSMLILDRERNLVELVKGDIRPLFGEYLNKTIPGWSIREL